MEIPIGSGVSGIFYNLRGNWFLLIKTFILSSLLLVYLILFSALSILIGLLLISNGLQSVVFNF